MGEIVNAPKGTKDVLPEDAFKWRFIEDKIRELTLRFGFGEIRTPVFEHTEVFERGVGSQTDIVQKEMYTFLDKAGRSITLKPEGTAGVVRAFIEKGMYSHSQPSKMYYLTPVLRYEAPQSGRLREHHQFGVEVFGAKKPSIDAEIIFMASTLLKELGISNVNLYINSIGCEKCRPSYQIALKEYLKGHASDLCTVCIGRYDRNPLRILDCKDSKCAQFANAAPKTIDYTCDDCRSHFEGLQDILRYANIEFSINPKIVRGLDYYTKTVFEFVSGDLGAHSTVCGGGRYDNLVESCGGPQISGVGFGMGIERLLMVMESQQINIIKPEAPFVYLTVLSESLRGILFNLVSKLRIHGVPAEMEHVGRKLKAQFKHADKLGVQWVCILGDDEHILGQIKLRNMQDGLEVSVDFESVVDFLTKKYNDYTGGLK